MVVLMGVKGWFYSHVYTHFEVAAPKIIENAVDIPSK